MSSSAKNALILVDIQYCFLEPDGSLAVTNSLKILPHVYSLLDSHQFDLVVASQDHHPKHHVSFASTHHKPVFSTIQVPLPPSNEKMIDQVLWPDHAVQGTRGSEIEDGVKQRLDKLNGKIVRKGEGRDRDDYDAFATPLEGWPKEEKYGPMMKLLVENEIETVYIVGLATDFCVRHTVLSALSSAVKSPKPWEVYVIREACKGVKEDMEAPTMREFEREGARVVGMEDEVVAKLRK